MNTEFIQYPSGALRSLKSFVSGFKSIPFDSDVVLATFRLLSLDT